MNIQTFELWARYHIWATHRLATSLQAISEEDFVKNCGLFFKSILGTLNHLLVAEHELWFSRFAQGVSPAIALNSIIETDRRQLLHRLCQSADQWQSLIRKLDQDTLEGVIRYRNTRGQDMSMPYAATLMHVFNHATHHRGQITAAMTALGYTSPELDMLFMLMEERQTTI
ncbi:DinB family protein [Acinetobacter terrestris]|uniref:Damage-inducible protein DinB n=1 Tax=Acinetobacter terrestris TaxID=2529843 RepID=A0ABX1UXL3_9GAMM|nr:DinB family protein [Acinetobacter terrestris]NNH27539.1 damage-inducible protein DinB [Acinetobacter terrestris]